MRAGDVVADRFALEQHAGSGGMGTVYRARDLVDGGLVALKLVGGVGAEPARFAREAAVLADLSHPRIVRYLGHGTTPSGEGWLAMEWLDGEDVGTRLARAGLDLRDSLALARGAAEGLAAAHRRGVVHRDVKPGNLFLPGLGVERVKVLDFGIARAVGAGRGPTRTGAIIGTPAYMAPEQARGGADVGPAADVFALGCLLYECVTGRPPFSGENVMAVLAKVLLAAAPPASSVRPGLPPALDALLSSMLAKDPDARLADAAAVVAAIDALGDVGAGTAPPAASRAPHLGALEQRVVCVVVAPPLDTDGLATTVTVDDEASAIEEARRVLAPLGGRLEWLADGSIVVSVLGDGAATDQAARAARCGLALLPVIGARPVYVATGRGVVGPRAPMGDVVDRAVAALAALAARPAPGVWLDEATALLLGDRFTLDVTDAGTLLVGDRDRAGSSRRLLGRPTRFVGREREIATLQALFEEAANESVARAALVVAPPGAGKSRVLDELLQRLGDGGSPLLAVVGAGDPSATGSPWSLLAHALRGAAGVPPGAKPDVGRAALERRVAAVLEGAEGARAAALLGVAAGLGPPPDPPDDVRAALADPGLLADAVAGAWTRWLAAEAEVAPVILVLDDLQWADLPSVKLLDAALRALASSPLFVLAAARPEVRDAFPALWRGRDVQELRLGGLTPRAAERMVRGALGDAADRDVVASIVERAQGNAFFLEELVRAVASGDASTLPDSVLGTVQARLDAIGAEARRVLRAASVFGVSFWRSGVAHLLGGDQRTTAVGEWLDELERREVVLRRAASRVPGDVEYLFPNVLLRDASYAMLTPDDRALGHRLAAAWLEPRPDVDPAVLAEHWEAAGEPARAAARFVEAADAARRASDLRASLALARRAIASGAAGTTRGDARTIEAAALHGMGLHAEALVAAREALDLLPPGAPAWHLAIVAGAMAAARSRAIDVVEELARLALAAPARDDADDPRWLGLCTCARMLVHARVPAADDVLSAMDGLPLDESRLGIHTRGTLAELRARRAQRRGDLGATLAGLEAAVASIERAGVAYVAEAYWAHLALLLLELGALERAEALAARAHASARRHGTGPLSYAAYVLARVLLESGRVGEARTLFDETSWRITEERMEAWSTWLRASLHRAEGDVGRARAEVRRALDALRAPHLRAPLLGLLADLLLEVGEPDEALAAATEGVAHAAASGEAFEEDLRLHLAHVRALRATGAVAAADEALAALRALLAQRAATLDDAARATYLATGVARAITADR